MKLGTPYRIVIQHLSQTVFSKRMESGSRRAPIRVRFSCVRLGGSSKK
jgi:hypothetical protein